MVHQLKRLKPLLGQGYHTTTPTPTYKHTHTHAHTHDIKSLAHRKQVDGSTVRYVHPGDKKIINYCLIIEINWLPCLCQ